MIKKVLINGISHEVSLTQTEIEAREAEITVALEAKNKLLIKQQIEDIEKTITQRRIREAILGIDNEWLSKKNAEILVLRGML